MNTQPHLASRIARTCLLLIITLALCLPTRSAAQVAPNMPGSVFTVDTTADEFDNCDPGSCSLREAIQAANGTPGLDQILFEHPGVYSLTRSGSGENLNETGDLDILDDLILSGENLTDTVIIDASGILDRVLFISTTVQVTITAVTIQNGSAPEDESVGGGGILVAGSLVLSDTLVTQNSAKNGGGVFNSLGQLLILGSVIAENNATDEGGGVHSDGNIEIRASQILSNTAQRGAGLNGTELADMLISDTLIDHNLASGFGGGIYNDKRIDLIDVTISHNQADRGGGIYSFSDSNLINVTINDNESTRGGGLFTASGNNVLQNVTISANQAALLGGGIFNEGILSLRNVTLYQNSAPAGNGNNLYSNPDEQGEITIRESILAVPLTSPPGDNCSGETGYVYSLGYNLESNNTCALFSTGDKRNISNPGLAPTLEYNSGKTKTHALLPGSQAIDGGNPKGCLLLDQRYLLRPVDGNENGVPLCDIGAFEVYTNGLVAFDPTAYVTDEPSSGTSQVTVFVKRLESNRRAEVDYYTHTPTVDILPAKGTLRWVEGQTTANLFEVTVKDDPFREDDETILIMLRNFKYGVGVFYPNHIASLTIWANDPDGIEQPPNFYLPVLYR